MRVIKRSIRRGKIKKKYISDIDDVICRFNLFVINIYNFNKLYHCTNDSYFMTNKTDLYTIYDILRKGDKFEVDEDDEFSKNAFQFFKEKFIPFYFNPTKKNNTDYIISSKYLDQVFKMNVDGIYSTITNNIIFRYDQYLTKFIKSFLSVQYKNKIEYNKIIKKASMYEKYLSVYKDGPDKGKFQCIELQNDPAKVQTIRNLVIIIATMIKHKCKFMFMETVKALAICLTGKLSNHAIVRTNKNIFNDELKEVNKFEEKFNQDKSLILKIIIGEKDFSLCEEKLDNESKSIFDVIDDYYPTNIELHEELSKNPFKFLPKMININNYLEANKIKTYKVFPTYNDPKIRHILLDSKCIDTICLCQKHNDNLLDSKEEIWKEVFNFPQSFFKMNNKLIFTGTIQTDGISMSLLYHSAEDETIARNTAKAGLVERNNDKILKDDISKMVDLEYAELKKKLDDKLMKLYLLKKKSSDDVVLKMHKITQELKELKKVSDTKKVMLYKFYKKHNEETKKISKKRSEENYKIKGNMYMDYIKILKSTDMNKYREISRKNKECYYLDDLTDNELGELKKIVKRIYIDLGKTNLIYALNDTNGKFMSYTSKERSIGLGTKKYTYNTEQLNKNLKISESNVKLKEISRRTANIDTIILNQGIINKEYAQMYKEHLSKRFRKEKLQKYVSTQKCESEMIKKLMNQLGIKDLKELKEYTLIIGDWGGCNNLKNSKPTLGIGMRRKLKKYFNLTYLLDETRTSIINNETHVPMKEATLEILCCKKEDPTETFIITKRIHGILSLQMEKSTSSSCKKLYNNSQEEKIEEIINGEKVIKVLINRFIKRDKNAVLNFKYLVEYYLLNNRERPEIFKRKPKEVIKLQLKETKSVKLKQSLHISKK